MTSVTFDKSQAEISTGLSECSIDSFDEQKRNQ